MFKPKTTDFDLSPYTGLTRESWIEAGEYILDGIFRHIRDFNDPVVLKRTETEVTYPHKNAPKEVLELEKKAEMFEGLTRTFFIAAPMIHINPSLVCNNLSLREYYKNQILRACTSGDEYCAGTYEELQAIEKFRDPFRCFQQTVETCALVIGLYLSKEEIWDTYTKAEKDVIAAFLSSFAKAPTVPQNWRLFNMLDMAFLHMEGYEINKNIMRDHAQAILNYYVGDGWYRDGMGFDYYSCWAFNVYGPIWSNWYGYENEPEIAAKFEEHSNKLMETYADFFDKDGFVNMWGRSNIYRNAATSAFDANFFLKNHKCNPGLARRISSGALMQFLGRDDTFMDGVLTLGFYKQFSPLVQGYSCAGSPFWMGKAFMCLHLPKDHPFWTEKEAESIFEKLGKGEVKETVLNGPGLVFSNHEANGETILRTGKVNNSKNDLHRTWNYGKLAYNTKYPWEATPVIINEVNIKSGEVESMQYILKDVTSGKVSSTNVTFYCGEKDGVLYRRQYFDFDISIENCWIQGINLADVTVPYGILRIDKHRLFRRPVEFTLGSYGFPDNNTQIKELSGPCNAKAIVFKGYDALGNEKQMAMTAYYGFESMGYIKSAGSNPDSEKSLIAYAKMSVNTMYDASEPYVMISLCITKESHEDFKEEDLFPIKEIINTDSAGTGSYGDTILKLRDGREVCVNFEGIEANLAL